MLYYGTYYTADVKHDLTCSGIPTKPKEDIALFNNGAGITPTKDVISTDAFHNIE